MPRDIKKKNEKSLDWKSYESVVCCYCLFITRALRAVAGGDIRHFPFSPTSSGSHPAGHEGSPTRVSLGPTSHAGKKMPCEQSQARLWGNLHLSEKWEHLHTLAPLLHDGLGGFCRLHSLPVRRTSSISLLS